MASLRSVSLLLCTLAACDQPAAPSKAPADAPSPVAKADAPSDAPAADDATASACTDFAFVLGPAKTAPHAPPTDEHPVADADVTHPLSVTFTCDGTASTLTLDPVALACAGASCGCTYALDGAGGVTPHNPDECTLEGDLDELAPLRATAPEGVDASWAILTDVERALIAGFDVYRIKSTQTGFDVVRETYSSGELTSSKSVASHLRG
ncbi:MAG: hypothetical protein AAGA54_15715 [Myxococcota bacterium]